MIRKGFKKVASAFLAMTLTAGILALDISPLSVSASALTGNASEDRLNEGTKNISDDIDYLNDRNVNHSFAYAVRMATNYANRQYADGNGIGAGSDSYIITMSNVGPFYGYSSGEISDDYVNSPENSRTGNTDVASSVMYSKSDIMAAESESEDGTESGELSASGSYYLYGLLLSSLGFDTVGSEAPDSTRLIYGSIAQLSYFVASSVNVIFEACFDFLYATNPFMFFKDINTSGSGKTELENIYDNAANAIGGDTEGSVGALAQFFGKIFNMFTDFAWTVSIPLSLLFIIITFFLTRRGRYSLGSNLKKFVVKVVFIAIGIPILGSAYTQVLDGLRDTQVYSDEFISQAVGHTFIDFRRWVESSRLSPPEPIGVVTDSGADGVCLVTGSTIRGIRKICFKINSKSGLFASEQPSNGLIVSKTGVLLKDYIYDTSADAVLSTSGEEGTNSAYDNRKAIGDLLKDYTEGTAYFATHFESGSKAWMAARPKTDTSWGDMLALSADKYSFSQNAKRQIQGLNGKVDDGFIKYNPLKPSDPDETSDYSTVANERFAKTDFAGIGYNIWNNGSITSNAGGSSGATNPTSGFTGVFFMDSPDAQGERNGYNCEQEIGLSTMSMYTYLTSEFTQAGVTTYGDSPTVYTHNAHHAVNLIGCNSVMQFAFLSNTVAILLGYFILAFAFVFRTVFDILFKGFQLMGHALLAAVGFYKSIGTCICMVVNMIVQLFITVVFFSLMSDFMFMVTSIFDHFFYDVLCDIDGIGYKFADMGFSVGSSYASEVVVILSSFLSALVIVFFVSFAVKWRALIMSTINSMVENVVGTILGVNLSGTSDGATGNIAKSALRDATNAGMAAAAIGGGTILANEVGNMAKDILTENGAGTDEDADAISAVDGAVEPTVGSGFNGGRGAEENDQASKAEGMDALENGLGEKEANKSETENNEKSSESDKTDKEKTDKTDERSDTNTYQSGTAERQAAMRDLDHGGGSASTEDDILPRENVSDRNTHKEGADEETLSRVSVPDKKGKTNKADKIDTKNDAESESENTENETKTNENAESSVNPKAEQFAEWKEAGAINGVQTDETAEGTEWKQTDAENGIESGISFDPTRGIVMTTVGDDGTVSDIALGVNGLSFGSTDEDGNKTVSTVGTNGMSTEYTGADGTTEKTTTTFDGLNSSVTVERSDADGNSETVTSGLDGQTVERIEKSEDGSVTTTTVNADGSETVETENAETGYHSVTETAVDGSSEQTETIGNVETITHTDADGNVTDKTTTSTDENGQKNVTSYSLNEDGSVTRSVQAGGVKTTTVENEDGSMTQTESSVLSNGTVAETTTQYSAEGKQTGEVKTTMRSADGKSVISQGSTSTGADNIGSYTMTTTETPTGSVQRKDYGGGHVVTTETAANGDMSVTETTGNGSYTITETSASTGHVTTTQISSSKAQSIISDRNGNILERNDLARGSDGSFSYNNLTGGSISTSFTGEGADRARVVSMSYASGGSDVVSINERTGNSIATVKNGMGGTSTIITDSGSGAVEVTENRADGAMVHSVTDSSGNYTETITQSNGSVRNTVRSGSGADAIEKVVYSDGAGNASVVTTEGGKVTYRSGNTSDGASYVQELNSSGKWETTQTLASGDKIQTVMSDGGYTRTVSYANGASRTEVLDNGKLDVSTTSVSGIETTSMRTGSVSSSTVQLDGMSVTEKVDKKTNVTTRSVEIAGNQYEVVTGADGSVKTSFEMPNNVYGSYKTNADGSQVHIIRQPDQSSRVETISAGGDSSVIYMDSMGRTVTAEYEVTRLNDAYASSISAFETSMASAKESLSSVNIDSFGGFEIPAPSMNMTMPGIMSSTGTGTDATTVLPGTSDEEFYKSLFASSIGVSELDLDNIPIGPMLEETGGPGGEFGRYDTWTGGSASGVKK